MALGLSSDRKSLEVIQVRYGYPQLYQGLAISSLNAGA